MGEIRKADKDIKRIHEEEKREYEGERGRE